MNTKTAKELIREYLTAEPKTSRISAGKFHHAVELVLSQLETCQLREDNKDHAITALRAERDELRTNIEAALYALETNRGDLSINQRQALDNLRAVLAKYEKE